MQMKYLQQVQWGELTKVNEIDGRIIENKNNSDITQRIISGI